MNSSVTSNFRVRTGHLSWLVAGLMVVVGFTWPGAIVAAPSDGPVERGPSVEPSVSPEASPSVEPSVSPEASPSVEPSVSPEASPSVDASPALQASSGLDPSPGIDPANLVCGAIVDFTPPTQSSAGSIALNPADGAQEFPLQRGSMDPEIVALLEALVEADNDFVCVETGIRMITQFAFFGIPNADAGTIDGVPLPVSSFTAAQTMALELADLLGGGGLSYVIVEEPGSPFTASESPFVNAGSLACASVDALNENSVTIEGSVFPLVPDAALSIDPSLFGRDVKLSVAVGKTGVVELSGFEECPSERCGIVLDFTQPTAIDPGGITLQWEEDYQLWVDQKFSLPRGAMDAESADLLGAMAQAGIGWACVDKDVGVIDITICGVPNAEAGTIDGFPAPVSRLSGAPLTTFELADRLTRRGSDSYVCFRPPLAGRDVQVTFYRECATIDALNDTSVSIEGTVLPFAPAPSVQVEPEAIGRDVTVDFVVTATGVTSLLAYSPGSCGPAVSAPPPAVSAPPTATTASQLPSAESFGVRAAGAVRGGATDRLTLPATDASASRRATTGSWPGIVLVALGLFTGAALLVASSALRRRL